MSRLKDSIVYAHKNFGGETKLMKHARYTYEYLKRREKVVRDVTRGMAVVTNTNAIAYGMDILGEALAHAVKYGMTDVPKIKSAEILFKNLARGRRARDMLRKIGKHVVMSNVPEQDLSDMIQIIEASMIDARNSAFPQDETVMSKAYEDLEVLQEKINVVREIDSAVKLKSLAKLHTASTSASKFREMHGLAHTATMDQKARQVEVLLKLRLFEQDLSVATSPPKKNNDGEEMDDDEGEGGDNDSKVDDILGDDEDFTEVEDIDYEDDGDNNINPNNDDDDDEIMNLINSLRTGSMMQKKQSIQKLQTLAGGEEQFTRTVRDHRYQHGAKSYRLGIRKDRRRKSVTRRRNLRTSPIKNQQRRRNVNMKDRPTWGVGERKWFVEKTDTPDRKKYSLNSTSPTERALAVLKNKSKRFAKGELLSGNISPTDATKRRNKNRAPEESIQEKQSILRQKSNHGNSLSLQYKISQHLLQSSIARQNEILENLAKDPNFMKTFGETLNYKLIEEK